MNSLFALIIGVLVGTGVFLLLSRSIVRVVIGLAFIAYGINLTILTVAGLSQASPPLLTLPGPYVDPLPQALILTAIVITFAVTAFLLAMIYRSWTLTSADVLADDTEDIKVSQSTAYDEEEDSPVAEDTTEFVDEEGRPIREGEE